MSYPERFAEHSLNMAALAWLREHSEHTSMMLMLADDDEPITAQIIEYVKDWLAAIEDGGATC
jgi:hypothetical protein